MLSTPDTAGRAGDACRAMDHKNWPWPSPNAAAMRAGETAECQLCSRAERRRPGFFDHIPDLPPHSGLRRRAMMA
jgi:hypothetical protein